ncbi:MAG: hypothetical protein AB7T49_03830 [Oligoflexales bacterium]
MKSLFACYLLAILVTSCGDNKRYGGNQTDWKSALRDENPIPLRGYGLISEIVRQRIVDDGNFRLGMYLESEPDDSQSSLTQLIMGPEGKGTRTIESTAIPNPINTFIWYIAMHGLATDIAEECYTVSDDADNAKLKLQPHLQEIIEDLCGEEAPAEPREESILKLWTELLQEDATDSDKSLWLALHTGIDRPNDKKQLVYEMVFTALFNHDFLAGK